MSKSINVEAVKASVTSVSAYFDENDSIYGVYFNIKTYSENGVELSNESFNKEKLDEETLDKVKGLLTQAQQEIEKELEFIINRKYKALLGEG